MNNIPDDIMRDATAACSGHGAAGAAAEFDALVLSVARALNAERERAANAAAAVIRSGRRP